MSLTSISCHKVVFSTTIFCVSPKTLHSSRHYCPSFFILLFCLSAALSVQHFLEDQRACRTVRFCDSILPRVTLLRSPLYQREFNSNGSRKMLCKCSPAGSRTTCLGSRAKRGQLFWVCLSQVQSRRTPTTTVRSSGVQTQNVQADTFIEVKQRTRNCRSRKFGLTFSAQT